MTGYGPSTYGDHIADSYDALHGEYDPAAIDLLASLAGDGPALELGIGTGRIALPLAERGVAVHGIDASGAMVERLRAKPGGDDIPVTMGDFQAFELGTRFSLVFVAFNTLFSLRSQEEQIRCFRCAAAHLLPGGCFLIEAFVPDPNRFDRGQRVAVSRIDADAVLLESATHDPVHQRVQSRLVRLSETGVRLFPIELRYAWPAELDLMAQLAELTLHARWDGWQRAPFTAASTSHVSVYVRG